MQSLRNRCGFLMLVKLTQIECGQGFVLLMYNFLEMLGKFMKFLLPSDNAVQGDSLRLFLVRALDPLNRMRGWHIVAEPRGLCPARDVFVRSSHQDLHPRGVRSRSESVDRVLSYPLPFS